MGFSSSMPIKKALVEVISVVTPVDKGKEKMIKQDVVKKAGC